MPVVTEPQPLVPEGIELSTIPRPDGYEGMLVEIKRTSDGVSTVMRLDYEVSKLHWAAQLLAYDNLFTLALNNFPLYRNGERIRDVTAGGYTLRR